MKVRIAFLSFFLAFAVIDAGCNKAPAPRTAARPLPAGPEVGLPAPNIEAEDIDGQRFQLSDYRGKVVLLDFWGNW